MLGFGTREGDQRKLLLKIKSLKEVRDTEENRANTKIL